MGPDFLCSRNPTLLDQGQPAEPLAFQSLDQWFVCSLLYLVNLPWGTQLDSHPPLAVLGSRAVYILSSNRKNRPSFKSWLPRAICNTHNVQKKMNSRALELPDNVAHEITHELQAREFAVMEGKRGVEALTLVHYILENILQDSHPGTEAGTHTWNTIIAANTLLRPFRTTPLILITATWGWMVLFEF